MTALPAPTDLSEHRDLTGARRHAEGVLAGLTTEQLAELAAGRARLVFRADATRRAPRPTAAPGPAPSDVTGAVETISGLTDPAAVDEYLRRHDAQLTLATLRELARALGPTVRTGGRTKTELRRDIVAGTAGYRSRSAAMSGGAWS